MTAESGIRSRGRPGQIGLPRWRIEDCDLDSFDLRVACWLASHTDRYRHDHVTRNAIAKATKMSGERASRSLRNLEQLGIVEITVQATRDGARFVIDFDHDMWETDPGRQTTTPRSPDDHPPGRQTTTTRALQDEEHRGETPSAATTTAVDVVAEWEVFFNHFWEAYPRKVGKPAARRAMKAIHQEHATREITEGTNAWINYWAHSRTEEKFIPHPATFLNQQRFNDTPPPISHRGDTPMDIIHRIASR